MRRVPTLRGAVANDKGSYQYLVESIRKFPKQEELEGMMRESGFKAVTHEDLTGGVVAIHSGFKL
jgi:ubiquinone/menaquinone biosynthesis C-methylase UbiE